VRELGPRHSGWPAAQELVKRWGRWGSYEGGCNAQHCLYEVELLDFAYSHSEMVGDRPYLWRLYEAIGGRPAPVRAYWDLEDGQVWTKGFGIYVEVPTQPQLPPSREAVGYALIAGFDSVWSFPNVRRGRRIMFIFLGVI
jgi:hypothetical protein